MREFDELPHAWWGPGNADLWGDSSTYQKVEYAHLPKVEANDFGYLAQRTGGRTFMGYGDDDYDQRPDIAKLTGEVRRAGYALPASFIELMSAPAKYINMPSCTSCYWQIGSLIELPDVNGPLRLLRFMNDQQAVLVWYLLLAPDGSHRVAVAAPEWKDDADQPTFDAAIIPREITICAESFQEFAKRFWIENVLWAAATYGRPIEGELRAYVDVARAVR